ncbi:MAG: hypothetical protein WAO95_08765 [Burkholderiales bacterium]
MTRTLRYLLLVVALLFSQHAAMLHGLGHAEHELALAAERDGDAPALDHGDNVCAAFGTLVHALGVGDAAQAVALRAFDEFFGSFQNAPAVTRVGFDSRAPPLSA